MRLFSTSSRHKLVMPSVRLLLYKIAVVILGSTPLGSIKLKNYFRYPNGSASFEIIHQLELFLDIRIFSLRYKLILAPVGLSYGNNFIVMFHSIASQLDVTAHKNCHFSVVDNSSLQHFPDRH